MIEPLHWLASVYTPHFLRRVGLEEFADELQAMGSPHPSQITGNASKVMRDAVAQRHGEAAIKLPPLPDDDPAKALIGGSEAALELWTIAERCGEILVADGQLTADELRAEQWRIFKTYQA
jgi:hypothetical protein